jgi:diaminopimelate epimerase
MSLFSKYSGAGNDFVIVRAEEIGLGDAAALARRICSRRRGVGVDGLILIRSLSEEMVRVRFFNPDGSEFATCGNGSRCAARYAADRGLTREELVLATDDGEILARVEDRRVSLDYSLDAAIERVIHATVAGVERTAWLVRMGTGHLVVPVDDVEVDDFHSVCEPLRRHPDAGPGGANVDLVERAGDRLRIRTFERGVEGETLACGSGCMASVLALTEAGMLPRGPDPIRLETRSGDVLQVTLLHEGRIRLSGPADHVFDGVLPDAEA